MMAHISSISSTQDTVLHPTTTEVPIDKPKEDPPSTFNFPPAGYGKREPKVNHGRGRTGRRITVKPPPGFKCEYCEVINEKQLPADLNNRQFKQDEWDHLVYKDEQEVKFPDRCGKFFKLSIKDRAIVLKETGFCPTCVIETKYHKDLTCKEVWDKNRARGSNISAIKCRAQGCFKHWSMCPRHRQRNKTRYREREKDSAAAVSHPSIALVTGLQSDIVEKATIHKNVPAGKEVDKVKEIFEKNTENMIDEGPGKDNTDLKQEQVNTNFAASTESHEKIVAEEEVQEMNEITETTKMESTETDSVKVCTTGTVKKVKEQEVIQKDDSTQKSAIEEEESGETPPNNTTSESSCETENTNSIKLRLHGTFSENYKEILENIDKLSMVDTNTRKDHTEKISVPMKTSEVKASFKKSDEVIKHEEPDNQEERIHPKDPKPTKGRSESYSRSVNDHTNPEGWKSRERDGKTKSTSLYPPEENQFPCSRAALHNQINTRAHPQEVSQRQDELKVEALEPNDDLPPTRPHKEVPSSLNHVCQKMDT